MPSYIDRKIKKPSKKMTKTLHVLVRPLHVSNRKTDNSMVVCSCFDGLKSLGVFTGRFSEQKKKISKKFLDTYDQIVYT